VFHIVLIGMTHLCVSAVTPRVDSSKPLTAVPLQFEKHFSLSCTRKQPRRQCEPGNQAQHACQPKSEKISTAKQSSSVIAPEHKWACGRKIV